MLYTIKGILHSVAPMTNNRQLAIWLLSVSTLIVVLIVYGGWVRLTRSGLSIVEWNVVTGIVPPIGTEAWASEFAKYQQTPEYQIVNYGMQLDEFKFIYYMEFGHRLLGRVAGLLFAVPLFYLLFRHALPRAHIASYLGIGLLFALQGLVGWLMVKSGLSDRPQVSHLRLTLHLSCALALLAACLWRAFDYLSPPTAPAVPRTTRRLCAGLFAAVCLQIAAGGLVAGLKAGHVADTFPRMFGAWVPAGLWALHPPLINLLDNATTVHFQHRFFAFVVLALVLALCAATRRAAPHLKTAALWVLGLIAVQIGLGIGTVILHVPLSLASLHQAVAVALFTATLFLCHRAYRYQAPVDTTLGK